MAGKVHTMDFVLNAALNGNFKGTFSRAQQEFVRLGKEIQGLNRLQSDISSYQKQQKEKGEAESVEPCSGVRTAQLPHFISLKTLP